MQLFCYVSIHIICLVWLWLSCYPGVIDHWGWLLLIFLILLFFLTAMILFLGGKLLMRSRRRNNLDRVIFSPPPYLSQLAIATKWTVILTIFLLITNLPQYLFFAISLPALSTLNPDCRKDCVVGLYRFQQVDHDGRGGAYFETSSGFLESSGFAYKPDPTWNRGAPKQSFRYYPFWGDWQLYEESHDWN